jgi:hypothetical protein
MSELVTKIDKLCITTRSYLDMNIAAGKAGEHNNLGDFQMDLFIK